MAGIFGTAAGTLIPIRAPQGDGPQQALLTIEGLEGASQDIIITNFRKTSGTNVRMTPTIGGPYYLFSFGQKLTEMQMSIISFPNSCDGETQSYQKLLKFYQDTRISPENAKPIRITYAGITHWAFILGLSDEANASQGFPVIQATLRMAGWVDEATVQSSGGGSSLAGGSSTPLPSSGGASLPSGSPSSPSFS